MTELSDKEKQLIWDSLVQYKAFCHMQASSTHFAKDVFAELEADTDKLLERFYKEWDGEIMH